MDAARHRLEGADRGEQHRIPGDPADHVAVPPAYSRNRGIAMIANLLTILIGLWLAYRAIFSVPAGELSGLEMTAAGVAVIVLALWARRTNLMGWSSGTNVLLGAVILALVALQRAVTADPLFTFWMMLLIGITVAIVAMWAMLYRLDPAQPANSP
jgi:hypothetical protein